MNLSITSIFKKNIKKSIFTMLFIFIFIFHASILTLIGEFTVRSDHLSRSDVVVVLNTGAGIYPRLMEAAKLYKKKYADKVLINGNRKNTALRKLEVMGYVPAVPWYANRVKILKMLGVPKKDILIVDGEDAYDTISEAKVVGEYLLQQNLLRIIVTSSKYHTRRAGYIWEKKFNDAMKITINPAQDDPFQPASWWSEGRQIRWVMAEYGAWFFLLWKEIVELI